MSVIKVCRICLRTEAKMYHYDRYQLKFYYEEVMAQRVNDEDGLPHYFCYECATILHKYHKFKEKCYNGQKLLKEMLWKGPITYESIYKLDLTDSMLMSSLDGIANSKRVRTYTARDSKEKSKDIDDKKITDLIEKTEQEYFSDTSMEFRENSNVSDEEKITVEIIPEDQDNIENGKKYVGKEKIIIIDKSKISYRDDDENAIDVKKEKIIFEADTPNIVSSPKTVYIDVDNGIIDTKDKEIKDKRKKKLQSFLRIKSLDDKHWKKSVLSESEALKEFRAKAEEKKYLEAAFKCTDCFKGFSKKDILMRHRLLKHAESIGPFECRFCRTRYRLDCYLRRHMKQHYSKFECLRCHLVCDVENTALLHEESHSGVTRKCMYCNEEFRHMSTYYTHLRTHRSEHVCTLCGASFVSAIGLKQHKHIKHVIMDIESPDDDEEVNTHCDRCSITFETRKAYEEHLFHSALHCNGEGEVAKEEASKKVLGKKEQAKITKGIRKRINVEDSIKLHEKKSRSRYRRKKTKPTTCHQCGLHFPTQAACMKHHAAAHPRTSFFPPADRYICEICGASLAPGSIATHQNMHTREKVHTCDTCGKQFYAIIGLKRHMVTHTGEKPFACPLCDKRFTQSNSMKLHYRTFHLKQPYPKRNRRKTPEQPKNAADADGEGYSSESESEESVPDVEPPPVCESGIEPVTDAVADRPSDENIHYLTLS